MKRVPIVVLAGIFLSACSSSEERAQSYYESGAKLLAAHENQKAAIEFKNAVQLNKKLLPAWRGLAAIDEQGHNWAELTGVLRTIADLDPKDTDAKLKLARLMLYGGATDEALKLVNGLEEADNSNANARALKAAILFKLKDNGGAVREAQTALSIDPNNVDAMIILAADRLKSGDPNGALQILNSGPVAHIAGLGVELFRIKIFEQLGDLPQVEALLKKLVDLYPQEVAFRRQLVKFYVDQHRPNDAESELRAIVAADPKSSAALLDLVRFLYVTKGPAPARSELVTRISAGGDVFTYQMALADFDYAQGNFADSFKLLELLTTDTSSPEHALAAKIKLAQMKLDRKDVDGAETLVSGILQGDSRNNDALRLRALIHMDRGQIEPAVSDLRQALNDQPRSIDLMVLLATAYERSGSIELAEKQFADATRASNYSPNVGLSYVAFLRRHGSTQRTEDVLTDLATRQPNNIAILSALAEVKLTLQDWAGAQEIGEFIKRIGDKSGTADQILGAALGGQNKYDQSIASFQSAVAAAPTATQPMVFLVRELLRAKQTDRAVSFLQTVLKTNPANAEALVLLGSIQLTNNAPDQAVNSFTTAIQKQPKDIVGYRALSDLYLSQKNNDAALKVIQAGLAELPDNIILHMALAGVLELKGDYDGVISQYEYVLNQQPGSLVAANNLASILADHRTDKASLDRAQTLALSLRNSPVPQFKDTLGWVSYRQGDFKTAIPLIEGAAAALPNVPLIHYHLGMGYAATGQSAKAAEEFKTVLAKVPSGDLAEMAKAELKKTATQ